MFNLTKKEINDIAKTNNFISNTVEKVLRLVDVLEFINESEYGTTLSLKGGTAINLCLLDLPRLSVDIDFDFAKECSREEMLKDREDIAQLITGYMLDQHYVLGSGSKKTHTLDSFVWKYDTLSNSKDSLKIEINYSNRCHVLDLVTTPSSNILCSPIQVFRLADEELIGSKINALIMRTVPRDVYDVYKLKKMNKIKNERLIKKIAIFYAVLSADKPIDFDALLDEACKKMAMLNYNKIRETVLPVVHKGEKVVIEEIASCVSEYVRTLFVLDEDEKEYIARYNAGEFRPDILFKDFQVNDVSKHPMALWKLMQ
ncbi:MAG: nucleotidyl transferase AbiEii/AbiGii toxin family protein [Bacilli bacterium]|nr:nucleotidyl transferase AbiEii/AbiGii toxin family protein [Bacilli bacterium]